jgi:hypothetical protein
MAHREVIHHSVLPLLQLVVEVAAQARALALPGVLVVAADGD